MGADVPGAAVRRFPWPRSRWGEIEIPGWLRHVTPWWFLLWLDKRYDNLCWPGIVHWKCGMGWPDWGHSRHCAEAGGYCGKIAHNEDRAKAAEILADATGEEVLLSAVKP